MTLLTLLSWLAVLVTAVGCYRLTTYFYRRDPLYAVLSGLTLTILFVAFFDEIVLATGALLLIGTVVYLLRDEQEGNLLPRPDFDRYGDQGRAVGQRVLAGVRRFWDRLNAVDLPLNSIWGNDGEQRVIDCPQCGRSVEYGDRFCSGCGHRFRWVAPAEERR